MRRIFIAALIVALPACKGGGDHQSGNPVAPSGGGASPAAGTWTGTITRPGELGTLSVRWEATTDTTKGAPELNGPMTLTNGAASVTVTAHAIPAGNDDRGYTLYVSFQSGAASGPFPSCFVTANTAGGGQGDPWPSPYTTITVPALQINYNGCRGFIDTGYSSAQSNSLQETVQLSMRK